MKLAVVLVAASLNVVDRPAPAPIDCVAVRRLVAEYGQAAVVAAARARGVPEDAIAEAARRCLAR